jgi:hypothetical protein
MTADAYADAELRAAVRAALVDLGAQLGVMPAELARALSFALLGARGNGLPRLRKAIKEVFPCSTT